MKQLLKKMDKPLLFMTILYSILGLVMILSASSVAAVLRYGQPSYNFFIRQLLFYGAAFSVGFIIVLRFPTGKYKLFIYLLLAGILASLFGLFIYGQITNGAQSWYRIGFFSLQPAEFAKSALIIFMAVFYDKSLKQNKNLYYNLFPIGVAVLIFALVAMQPDLGGALIIAFIVFLIFIKLPLKKDGKIKLIKIIGVSVGIILFAFVYKGNDLLNSMQLDRLTFKNPCSRYTENTGYQVCNGYIAINNGGLFGVGLGNSTQKYLYLPEAHTDFIFPILVEELGLIFAVFVLIGYIFILYRILKIAKNASTTRGMILSYGTFLLILMHLLINLLGVLALIPLTGVPLPFLSYGGSFSINVILMIFVVERVAIENNNAKVKKELASLK